MALGLRLRHKVKLQKAPTVFVASPGAPHIKRYLAGGGVNQPVGLCAVCKQRAALSQWKKKIMKKIEAETKAEPEQVKPDETKSDEAAGKATTCGHRLTCHPGCSNPDGRHNHSAWWPRERCDDEACRARVRGWNLREIQAASRKAKRTENFGSVLFGRC